MKKTIILLAAMAMTASASTQAAKVHRTVEHKAAPAMSIMERENAPEKLEVKLVPTGRHIGDAQVQTLTGKRAGTGVIIHELFENFTQGSQSNPYGPLNNSGGTIPAQYHPNSPNLFGWGVYSCGGWAMLRGNDAEFRITGIDLTKDLTDLEIAVAALSSNCQLAFCIINGATNEQITNVDPVSVPYDGEFYTLQTSKNAVKNLSNAQLMIFEYNGNDIAIGGIYMEGGIGSNTGGNTGGGNDPEPPVSDVEIGKVTNVSHSISRNKQSFTASWTAAKGASSHEIKVYNDVFATEPISSMKLLDMDYSTVKGGSSNPYSPNTAYWKNETMYLDAMPGGKVHNLVLLNGAIGFANIPSYIETQYETPGFQTDVFDFSPTNGVFHMKMDYYATAGCGIYIAEFAWNNSTNGWELVDEGEFDETNGGLMIETDEDSPWDYLDIEFDKLSSKYSGEVIIALGVYSVLGATDESVEDPYNSPVFFYMKNLSITMKNIPSGSHFYYTYFDNPAAQTSQTVTGDISNNYFNYTVRGVGTGSNGVVGFGPWYTDTKSSNGCVWVTEEPNWGSDGIETIEVASPVAPAIYYNMQGQRVANPKDGLFIRVQGNSVKKVAM